MKGTQGFYARDPEGRDYAGIYVFTRTAPTVGGQPLAAGMIVNVTGKFEHYNEAIDQITTPTMTLVAATGGDVTPVDVTTAELTGGSASGEKLESLLVRIQNVTVKVKVPNDDDFYATDSETETCTGTPVPACARISDFLIEPDAKTANSSNGTPATTVDQKFTSIVDVIDGFAKQQAVNIVTAV